MHPMLNMAVRAARRAGNVINRYSFDLEQIKVEKKALNDFVTEVDKAAEETIIDFLLETYPKHTVLSEESGQLEKNKDSDFVWIIDPLDGTTNYMHGFSPYCVSIALQEKGVTTLGVIYDPEKNDLFTAIKGKGAFLNNHRIRVSKKEQLSQALLVTGFANRDNDTQALNSFLQQFRLMTTQCQGIRRTGSAALDLAYVACGRFDGYFEQRLKIWDIAAGALMVKEAGGIITDYSGEPNFLSSGDVIAGNPRIFNLMLNQLKKIV